MINKTRVALADDHPIFLAGLRNLIEAETDLELVGHATTGGAALELIREKLPHVAIVDISMPGLSGIELAHRLSADCPSVRILILTLYEERSFVMRALAAGAKGYLLKRSASESLTDAIRAVTLGDLYIDPSLSDGLRDTTVTKSDNPLHAGNMAGLTARETDVLKFSAQGLTIKEIAARLDLSGKTVETYKSRAAEKLQLKTRVEIIRFASAQGWLG